MIEQCPVCEGSGKGFERKLMMPKYRSVGHSRNIMDDSKMIDVPNDKLCHGCSGKGWVEIGRPGFSPEFLEHYEGYLKFLRESGATDPSATVLDEVETCPPKPRCSLCFGGGKVLSLPRLLLVGCRHWPIAEPCPRCSHDPTVTISDEVETK